MTYELRPIAPAKAADLIARMLRSQIVDGTLAEGTRLPTEHVLIQTFKVSRPTLREALHLLAAEELVVQRRGAHGGPVVRRPTAAPALGLAATWWALNGGDPIDAEVVEQAADDPAVIKALTRLCQRMTTGKFRSVA